MRLLTKAVEITSESPRLQGGASKKINCMIDCSNYLPPFSKGGDTMKGKFYFTVIPSFKSSNVTKVEDNP
jgi:hypothetical protein